MVAYDGTLARLPGAAVQELPSILSKDEVSRLIACVGHIKHQTALSLAYGTGLAVLKNSPSHQAVKNAAYR